MSTEPLCLTCGYWVADTGDQCEMCRSDPSLGAGPGAPVVHLAEPGARRTLCGLGDRKGPTTPYRSIDAPPRLPGNETVCTDCAAVRFPA